MSLWAGSVVTVFRKRNVLQLAMHLKREPFLLSVLKVKTDDTRSNLTFTFQPLIYVCIHVMYNIVFLSTQGIRPDL